jgi:hypothetical protein
MTNLTSKTLPSNYYYPSFNVWKKLVLFSLEDGSVLHFLFCHLLICKVDVCALDEVLILCKLEAMCLRVPSDTRSAWMELMFVLQLMKSETRRLTE